MFSRRLASLCFALLAALSTTCALARAAGSNADQTWLVASDIHLNDFVRGDPSLLGSDTNVALFDSAIAEMKREVPDPAVVLLPGDFFVHDFPLVVRRQDRGAPATRAAIQTMRTIAAAFTRTYPHARFAIAVGNNDAPCGDYRTDVDDPYLAAVARIWAPLIDRGGAAPNFVRAFRRGGYYTATLPVRGLRLVVLNTIFFSSEYHGTCKAAAHNGATAQLQWLGTTLHDTPAGVRNVVMMHIPPGYDALSTEAVHGLVPWQFLNSSDNAALVAALGAPDNRVAYAIAGHTHRFDFRLIGGVPMLVFGSISPVYSNNPAFYALHVDANGALRDVDVFPYDEWSGEWTGARSFDQKWGVDRIDAATLARLHAQLATDAAMRRKWDIQSNNWLSNPGIMWAMWGKFWRVPWCAQVVMDGGFTQCSGIGKRVALGRVVLGVVAAAALAVLAVIVLLIVRAARKRAALRP
ncbi:MAG TPA: metallophosphoesterase [Candidatus Baltobacteraceae bacterium]|nr:metallophosphoesterase [Candidatus Baltobacteraceae bacterium]